MVLRSGAWRKVEAADSAQAANCRYVDDTAPGITRKRVGKGFTYADATGRRIADATTFTRIRSLVIPPAWTSPTLS